MKSLIAGILTAVVLVAILVLGSRAPNPGPSSEIPSESGAEPVANPAEEAVRTLIRRGDAGDVDGYLDCFAQPLRERLGREIAERGREVFADDLRRAGGSRKGHAVYAAESEGVDAAKVSVETVYPDRNERRIYRLVEFPEGWKIAEVATVRTRQPSDKFGTHVAPIEPEATDATPPAPKVGLSVETGDDPDPP